MQAAEARETIGWLRGWGRRLVDWLVAFAVANPVVVAAAAAGLVRACGKTVESGQVGLKFSLGRAKRTLEPGFHLLIPFFQVVRIVPSRSRTLELEDQRIVTQEGLVFLCRANLVWRIADVYKALIEVDDVQRAMRQVLAISVQELLGGATRGELVRSAELDASLAARMATRLDPWGVVVEHAGFQSIAPSQRTIRITQLRERVTARIVGCNMLRELGLDDEVAVGLVGTRFMPRRRAVRARSRSAQGRRERLLRGQRDKLLRENAAATKISRRALAAMTPELRRAHIRLERETRRANARDGKTDRPDEASEERGSERNDGRRAR